MNKIPTAREFYDAHYSDDAVVMMIEFAKLHVTEASKAYFEEIKKEGLVTEAGIAYLERAYPLENIK